MDKSNENTYKKYYEEFEQSVAFAIRTWHHHFHLQTRADEDPGILATLNDSPRFWLDHRYSALQTTIISLGKIFDADSKAHNVDKTLAAARIALDYFKKSELRKRKIDIGGEFESIDAYIAGVHELENSDLKTISAEVKKAKLVWKRIKPLRNRIFAHNQMLSDSERRDLFSAVTFADINEILRILANVSNVLWEAEHNGRRPDFSNDCLKLFQYAKDDVEKLICSLLHASPTKS